MKTAEDAYVSTVSRAEENYEKDYCRLTGNYYDQIARINLGYGVDATLYQSGTTSTNVQVCFAAGFEIECTRQHRHDNRRFFRRFRTAEKQPILSSNHEFSKRSFRNIIVNVQSSVRTITTQRRLVVQRIRTRLSQQDILREIKRINSYNY